MLAFCGFFKRVISSVRISSSRVYEKIHKPRLKMLKKNRRDKNIIDSEKGQHVLTFWKKEDAQSKTLFRKLHLINEQGYDLEQMPMSIPMYTHTQLPHCRVECKYVSFQSKVEQF